MPEPKSVAEVWIRQARWSAAADRLKKSIDDWRRWLLVAAIAGAVSGTAGAMVMPASTGWGRALVIASAVCVGVLPVFRSKVTGPVLLDWTNTRAVSEALKTEMYLFLAGAGAYATAADPQAALIEQTEEAEKVGRRQLRFLPDRPPADPVLPAVTDATGYFTVRVQGQIDYYGHHADRFRTYLSRFKVVEITFTVAGVVLGAFAAVFTRAGLSEWVAVATTVAAAVAARSVAGQYEFQMIEYLSTRADLENVQRRAKLTTDPATRLKLVERSEQILSAQNRGWIAQLATDPTTETAVPAQGTGPESETEARTTG